MVKADCRLYEQLRRYPLRCKRTRYRLPNQQFQQVYSGCTGIRIHHRPPFGIKILQRSGTLSFPGHLRPMGNNGKGHGKWRFTSPTHVVRAFKQALTELIEEGGVEARYQRYCENHRILVEGMRALGFKTLLEDDIQSPIITSFLYPHEGFDFKTFYYALKNKGFVIYPGKISKADTFRIGNIGDVHPEDFRRLVEVIRETKY